MADKTHSVDILIIGTGSGTHILNDIPHNKTVAIIEKGEAGGTCLTRGCIPSKILIHSADVAEQIAHAKKFGLNAKVSSIDFKTITSKATHKVLGSSRNIEKNLQSLKNVKYFKGFAEFIGDRTIKVGSNIVRAEKVLIATGARPTIPNIPGLDSVKYWTSTEALRATKQPKSMIVLGGGYIATELAHFYGALGTDITMIQRSDVLMSREDREVSELLTKTFSEKYTILTNSETKKVWQKGKKIFVEVKTKKGKKTISAEALLVATGVTPNSELHLEKTGVRTNTKGFIQVNEFLEAGKNIWALGDVIGTFMLKHSANYEAEVISENLLFGKQKRRDYTAMPYAVFTSPQIAGVGESEEELQEKGLHYVVGRHEYIKTGMGLALQDEDGFVKILVDPKTRKILSCRVVGEQASTLIHEVLVVMRNNLTVDAIENTIHIHPALSEVVQRAVWNIDWDHEY